MGTNDSHRGQRQVASGGGVDISGIIASSADNGAPPPKTPAKAKRSKKKRAQGDKKIVLLSHASHQLEESERNGAPNNVRVGSTAKNYVFDNEQQIQQAAGKDGKNAATNAAVTSNCVHKKNRNGNNGNGKGSKNAKNYKKQKAADNGKQQDRNTQRKTAFRGNNNDGCSNSKSSSLVDSQTKKEHQHGIPVSVQIKPTAQMLGGKDPGVPISIQCGNEGGDKAMILLKKHGDEDKGAAKRCDPAEMLILKQHLFEANASLEKEKNTRVMLETKVKSITLELKKVKDNLGGDKHYCIGTLKEELDFEQKMRVSVQNELAETNAVVISEREKIKSLEKQLQSAKKASDDSNNLLQLAKNEFESERARQQMMNEQLAAEKKKNEHLQKRLQYEVASNISMRMELQSIRGRDGKVKQLQDELIKDHRKLEAAEHTAFILRQELQTANEELRRRKISTAEAGKNGDDGDDDTGHPPLKQQQKDTKGNKDILIRKLRKELQSTREKLKSQREETDLGLKPQKRAPQLSLSDWVNIAPTSGAQHAGLIPIIQSPSSTNMPRPVQTSLPSPSRDSETHEDYPKEPPMLESGSTEEASSSSHSEFAHLFHFEDDDASVACDKALEPLHDELTFIRSAYDEEEVIIEGNKCTHLIDLTTWFDSEIIPIALSVIIPNNYPASGSLEVKASIHGPTTCSQALRKCAIDALPKLEEICMMEAKANEGKESIHPVFSVAGGWAITDWYNILSKEFSIKDDAKEECGGENSTEITAALIQSHHIVEADKIQWVKKNASKLSLGGYIKVGKPGVILVEGSGADCDQFLDALNHNKKNFHVSTFKDGGRVLRNVSDVDSRFLPRKMEQLESKIGMDKLLSACEQLGLLEALNDIISF